MIFFSILHKRQAISERICTFLAVTALLIATLMSASIKAETSLTFKDYLQKYFTQNSDVISAAINRDLETVRSEALDDNFNSSLTINPEESRSNDKLINITSLKTKTLAADLTTQLPTGTRVSIGGTKWLENDPLINTIDHSLYVEIRQNLYRNFLGVNQRREKLRTKTLAQLARLNYSLEMANQCSQAINTFIDAYKSQRELVIFKNLDSTAEKTFSTIKGSYQRRLTNKMDYLAAKTDQLGSKQRKILSEAAHVKNIQTLKASLPLFKADNVQLSSDYKITGINSEKSYRLSNLYIKIYDETIQQNELNYLAGKNSRDPELDLYVRGSKNNNQFERSPLSVDEENLTVGVNFVLPINQKKLNLASKENYYLWQRSKQEKIKNIKKLQTDLENIIQQSKLTSEKVRVFQLEKEALKKQSKEAMRLLRSGQIEFRDYIFYRNQQVLNEQNEIELLRESLLNKVTLTLLTTPEQHPCKEGQL